MVYHKVLFWDLFFLVSLSMTFHYMWKIYLLIVTCWQMTQHCTHVEKDIMQIRSNMQDSLDQVSNWCDNNHMVIHPIKTKSMTIATRQKHLVTLTTRSRSKRGENWSSVRIPSFRYNLDFVDFAGTRILIMCANQFQDEASLKFLL